MYNSLPYAISVSTLTVPTIWIQKSKFQFTIVSFAGISSPTSSLQGHHLPSYRPSKELHQCSNWFVIGFWILLDHQHYLLNTNKSPTRDTYKMSWHCPETNNRFFKGGNTLILANTILNQTGRQLRQIRSNRIKDFYFYFYYS